MRAGAAPAGPAESRSHSDGTVPRHSSSHRTFSFRIPHATILKCLLLGRLLTTQIKKRMHSTPLTHHRSNGEKSHYQRLSP